MYHDARLDLKLQSLSDAQHRVWFNLLCYASEQGTRGTIAAKSLTVLAIEVARGDTDLLEDTLATLETLDIVQRKNNKVIITHWKERQFASDSSTPRVKKHRQKKSDPPKPDVALVSEVERNTDETLHERFSNTDETLPKRDVTPPDTDTDTDPEADPEQKTKTRDTDLCDPTKTLVLDPPARPSEIPKDLCPPFERIWSQKLPAEVRSALNALDLVPGAKILTTDEDELILLHHDGVPWDQVTLELRRAVERGKPFAYAKATLRNKLRTGEYEPPAPVLASPRASPRPPSPDPVYDATFQYVLSVYERNGGVPQ